MWQWPKWWKNDDRKSVNDQPIAKYTKKILLLKIIENNTSNGGKFNNYINILMKFGTKN